MSSSGGRLAFSHRQAGCNVDDVHALAKWILIHRVKYYMAVDHFHQISRLEIAFGG